VISKLREKFQHRYNSFFGLLGVAIPTLIVVVSYRLLLDGLGEVGFGVYLLAASIGSVMAFMDLGISSANIKFIAEDKESGSYEALANVVQTSACFYCVLGLFIVVSVAAMSPALDTVFGITEEYRSSSFLLFVLAAGQVSLYLVNNVYIGVLKALGRFDLAVIVTISIPLITMGLGGYLVATSVLGLLGLMWLGVIGSFLGLMLSIYLARSLCQSSGFDLLGGRPSIDTFKRMYGFSAVLTLHSFAGIFFAQAQKIFIGHALGPASVGIYQFAYTALSKIHTLINSGSEFIYPLASSGKCKVELRAVYLRVLLFTALTAFIGLLVFWWAADFIFGLWLGSDVASRVVPLIPSLVIAFFFVALSIPGHHILNGLGYPGVNVLYSIVNVVLYLIVLFCLSTHSLDFGLISYAYAYAVSNVISGAVFQVLFEFLFWPRFMRDEL
jgi:O-antigen/teichoic acid export membrane protein